MNAGEGDRQGGVMLFDSVPGHHFFNNLHPPSTPSLFHFVPIINQACWSSSLFEQNGAVRFPALSWVERQLEGPWMLYRLGTRLFTRRFHPIRIRAGSGIDGLRHSRLNCPIRPSPEPLRLHRLVIKLNPRSYLQYHASIANSALRADAGRQSWFCDHYHCRRHEGWFIGLRRQASDYEIQQRPSLVCGR